MPAGLSYRGEKQFSGCGVAPVWWALAGIAAKRRDGQLIIGFAAEEGEDIARAQQERERKGVDLIVLNDISDPALGFDSDDNAVVLITANDETRIARAPKSQIAAAIFDRVEALVF